MSNQLVLKDKILKEFLNEANEKFSSNVSYVTVHLQNMDISGFVVDSKATLLVKFTGGPLKRCMESFNYYDSRAVAAIIHRYKDITRKIKQYNDERKEAFAEKILKEYFK